MAERLARALCRAAVIALLLSNGALGQGPSGQFEKGLFDVRVGELLTVSAIGLVNERGIILLPVDAMLSLTGLTLLPGSNDSTRLIPAFGSTTPAVLDLRRRNIRRLGMTYPIAADEVTVLGSDVYLASDRLAEFLDAKVLADMGSLQVFIAREPPFPSEQLLATRERRAVYGVGPRPVESSVDATFLRRTGGVGLDWNLSSSGSDRAQDVGLQLQAGGAVYGGAISAATSVTRVGVDKQALSSSWQYTFVTPASDWLRTVQVGNAAAGTSGRSVQGFTVSNARTLRSGAFSVLKLVPDSPPGWSYEVYQDGRLIGFSEATRRTPVPVQLGYGSTPVEIRYHGPAGEEIRSTYVYQIDIERLPTGRAEYGVGAGACSHVANCRVAFANLAGGLTSWLTASGGAEAVDSTTRRTNPFGRLLFSTVTGWKAIAEWTPVTAHGSVAYFGPGTVVGSLNGGVIGEAGPVASYTAALGRRSFIEPSLTVPVWRMAGGSPATLRLEGRAERPRDGSRDRLRASAVLNVAQIQGSVQYDDDIITQSAQVTSGILWLTPSSWGQFGRTPLSASIGTQRGTIQSAQIATTYGSGGQSSVNVEARWSNGPTGGPSLAVTYNAFTGQLRRAFGLTSAPNRPTTMNALVASLATYDPRFGLTSTDRSAGNSASLAGRAFYDENGDGVFGEGDRPAEGAIIQVGGTTATTRSDGQYRIIGILPYEPMRISVDTVEGIDPSYVPTNPARTVRLSPNVFTRFDVPLLRTREVVGTLTADTLVATTAGVTVELRESTTGGTYTTSTFADGTFYLGRVTPGLYELTVSPRSLAALKATVVGGHATFRVSAQGDETIHAPAVTLRAIDQRLPSSP